jgi:DNA repair protein RadC
VDNNLNAGKLSISQLMNFKGIGRPKPISALEEEGRRSEEAVELIKITSSKMIFEIMQPIMVNYRTRNFGCLFE